MPAKNKKLFDQVHFFIKIESANSNNNGHREINLGRSFYGRWDGEQSDVSFVGRSKIFVVENVVEKIK